MRNLILSGNDLGAPLRAYEGSRSSGTLTIEEIEILAREGLEIPLGEINVLEDGTLIYKNRRVVLLYIRDVKQYRKTEVGRTAALSHRQLR